jgi:hypothetical protein
MLFVSELVAALPRCFRAARRSFRFMGTSKNSSRRPTNLTRSPRAVKVDERVNDGADDVERRLEAISTKGDPLETINVVPWEGFCADIGAVTEERAPPPHRARLADKLASAAAFRRETIQ